MSDITIKTPSLKKTLFKDSHSASRYGGILLHPTSLPGEYGIGDLGPEIYKFIDFLKDCEQNLWQILSLGPTGYGNSPYQCFSAFAGNSIIISPEKLCEIKLLTETECKPQEPFSNLTVDFSKVIPYKEELLKIAFEKFLKVHPPSLVKEFNEFKNKHAFWLNDYCVFMSIKQAHNFKPWNKWDEELRYRYISPLNRWKNEHKKEIEFHKFIQYLFFKQWNDVKRYANLNKIKIIGDIPIFVAYDSVDVWVHPEHYNLNEKRELIYVAGVPPDYFSVTGQRWGNPLYNWNVMRDQNYQWWIQRIKHNLELVDILRIDHFRGFEAYWQISANEDTAINGDWVKGPGLDFFIILKDSLGSLPIIAEDLGLITPDVEELLYQTGFPGMRVLQFAFDDSDSDSKYNKYLPHNFHPNTIVYTGTHDNQTSKAWFENLTESIKKKVLDYTNSNGKDIVGDLIRLAWASVAKMAVIPLQDLLRLGDEARMNLPGSIKNNWEWRFNWNQVTINYGKEIKSLSRLYDRVQQINIKREKKKNS